MRKLFNLLLLIAFTATTSIVLATTPPESTPVQNPEDTPIESIVPNAHVITEPEIPQIKTEPMSAKIDEASDVKPYDVNNLPKERLPEPKNELQKLALMFLQVVLGVVVSVIVIYFFALQAKKFLPAKTPTGPAEEIKEDLKSSTSDSEALKTFLNKTKNH